jgi:hypothetical protein
VQVSGVERGFLARFKEHFRLVGHNYKIQEFPLVGHNLYNLKSRANLKLLFDAYRDLELLVSAGISAIDIFLAS